MYDILIINGCVITVDAKHTIHNPGYLAIKGESISAIGPMSELTPLPAAARVIDASGRAVLPGMIDAHGHAGHCFTKNLRGDKIHESWTDMADDIYYHYTDEFFWATDGALAAAERAKFGITTAVSMLGSTPRMDDIWPVRASLEGSARVGIRQMTGIGTAARGWPKVGRTYSGMGDEYTEVEVMAEKAYEVTERMMKELHGKLNRQFCLVAPGKMGFRKGESEAANISHNKAMYRIAKEYGVPLHTHGSGGDIQFMYDHSPEVLGPWLSLTHSFGYSQRELEILKETGTYVFHAPSAHANILGHCPVFEMLEMGINLVLVTDGPAPDRSCDIWRDMKTIMTLQRFRLKNADILPCGTVLELCTIRAAEALGLGQVTGSLEVGKKADVITVNVEQAHLTPFGDMPIQRLVYYAMGQDVDMTIVEGEIIMENRLLTRIDEKALIADAHEVYATMMRRFNKPETALEQNIYGLRYK